MRPTAPPQLANPGPAHSETTRLLCASVFLGYADEIRQKVRTYLLDRHHAAPENPGLNIRLLARVLDYFLARRLRYLVWHGPVGLVSLVALAVVISPAGEMPRGWTPLLILPLMLVLGVIRYLWLRHTERHALQYFGRETFDSREAMARFASRPEDPGIERDMPVPDGAINVCVYGGFDPFVGSGASLGEWSLLIDTRKGKEGGAPMKLTAPELERYIAASFRHLSLPGLRISERLYVHGVDVPSIEGLLPDPLGRPRLKVSEEALAHFRYTEAREARIYQSVEVLTWEEQVRVACYYRATLRGPLLAVDCHTRVLQPVDAQYGAVDTLPRRGLMTETLRLLGQVLFAHLLCVYECLQLLWLMGSAFNAHQQHMRERKRIKHSRRYNYGMTMSLRESFAAPLYRHFFEKADRDLHLRALQRELLNSIVDFLDSRKIDTSELREQRTFMINSGLIVHGNVQADALAVGRSVKAKSHSAPGSKASGKAEGVSP